MNQTLIRNISCWLGLVLIGSWYSCSENSGEVPGKRIPQILNIRIDDTWNLAETDSNIVEAELYDPQGIEDIKEVTVVIKNSAGRVLLTAPLFDDGAYLNPQSGDVIAGDGVFRNRFDAARDVDTTTGTYTVEINALDLEGNQAEPVFADILLGYSYPTEFLKVDIPDTLKSGTAEEFFYVSVFNEGGITTLTQISYKFFRHTQTALLESNLLFNDGNFSGSGDLVANDSIFSYRIDSSFAAGRVGLYDIQFESNGQFGRIDQSARFPMYLENKVGQIIATNVTERMQRPAATGIYNRELLTAQVSDPQGLADVDSVFFFSRKPDGTFANSGRPFVLVDNGKPFNIDNPFVEVGDINARDGIYSFSLLLYSDALAGRYVFSFYLRDKVGNLTAVKLDSIEVY